MPAESAATSAVSAALQSTRNQQEIVSLLKADATLTTCFLNNCAVISTGGKLVIERLAKINHSFKKRKKTEKH